jgi:putative nucleotidyltransferase with HDIG domain
VRESLGHWWQTNQLWFAWTMLVVPLVLELIYGTFLLPYLLLTPVSILATYLIYRSARSRLQSKTNEIEALSELHLATAEALATAIDAKDQTTHCHVRRVQIYAAGMGEVFRLAPHEIAALKAGALLHDIGKLAVPPHILNKPGPLTPAEFEKMKIHTVVGAQILSRVDFPYPVIPIIRHHHEQWDGRGYPDHRTHHLGGRLFRLDSRRPAFPPWHDDGRSDGVTAARRRDSLRSRGRRTVSQALAAFRRANR